MHELAQICPYHERLQKDVNGLSDLVAEMREWKAAQAERQKSFEDKIEQAIIWMKWAVGLSITTVIAMLGIVASFVFK